MGRLFYVDNIRAAMIILVIFIHSAVTYSGMGSWYYKEEQALDALSFVAFGFFQSWTQAYFMGILFFFAGYFAAEALNRKTREKFIYDRLIRLGMPTLIYILILHYLNGVLLGTAPSYPDYLSGALKLVANTGPTWFLLALLIFTVIYALTAKPTTKTAQTPKNLTTIILILTLATFLTRIFQPIDSSILNMQLPYFPQYITLFILGTIAYHRDWINSLTKERGYRILRNTLIIGLPLWIITLILSGVMDGRNDFKGGLNGASLAYSLWESLMCIGITIGLTTLFREKYNVQTKLTKFFTDNSFAAYVIHAPVLIAVSLLMVGWIVPPIAKFLVVGMMAVIATFIIAGLMRKTPMKRIM